MFENFDHLYHFLLPKSLLTFFKYDFNHWSSIQPVDISFFKLSVISGLNTKFLHNFVKVFSNHDDSLFPKKGSFFFLFIGAQENTHLLLKQK